MAEAIKTMTSGPYKLQEFYKLLAMRQVFTVPSSPYISRSRFLTLTPKAINWFPVVILMAIIFNDLQTKFIGNELGKTHYLVNVSCESLATLLVGFLSYSVTVRLRRMDAIWAHYWSRLNDFKPQVVGGFNPGRASVAASSGGS